MNSNGNWIFEKFMSVMLKSKEIPKQAAWKKASIVSFDMAHATAFRSCFEGAAVKINDMARNMANILMKKLVLMIVMISIHPKNKNVDIKSGAKEIIKPCINDSCGLSPVAIFPWGATPNPLGFLHLISIRSTGTPHIKLKKRWLNSWTITPKKKKMFKQARITPRVKENKYHTSWEVIQIPRTQYQKSIAKYMQYCWNGHF